MSLTLQQLQTLKADILADGTLAPLFTVGLNSDAAFTIAAAYNLPSANANNQCFRSSVSIAETGAAFNGTELAGLTSANQTRLQTLAVYFDSGYNASKPDVRQFFNDVFSGAGGTNTRANLATLWNRTMTRLEKLFATGTGSTASPATLVVEGAVSYQDVQNARNS